MKKDIQMAAVTDVGVAAVHEEGDWKVYLINFKKEKLKNVIVSSSGYGSEINPGVKTSSLRFFFDEVGPSDFVIVETIMENLFELNNEYWVSFYIGDEIYDKRFIFVPGSIQVSNLIHISLLQKDGVLIR